MQGDYEQITSDNNEHMTGSTHILFAAIAADKLKIGIELIIKRSSWIIRTYFKYTLKKKSTLELMSTIPCGEAWSKVGQRRILEESITEPFCQTKPQAATKIAYQIKITIATHNYYDMNNESSFCTSLIKSDTLS